MKHIKIELVPFYKTLKVYFTDKPYQLRAIYPDCDMREPGNGEYFRLPDKGKELTDTILINLDEEWKKADWPDKVGLIAHEVSHCMWWLCDYSGIKDTEFIAYYTQYILTVILRQYDFEKDEIK